MSEWLWGRGEMRVDAPLGEKENPSAVEIMVATKADNKTATSAFDAGMIQLRR